MTAGIPVLPLAGATLARGFIGLSEQFARAANAVARAMRNRRDARILAGLDRHMLADIGITRSDVNDAFSAPFWADPTELLRERVQERRAYRPAQMQVLTAPPLQSGFHRLPTDRPARHAI
jgi:uncharacterized protein YjiS (DUF1127 family)